MTLAARFPRLNECLQRFEQHRLLVAFVITFAIFAFYSLRLEAPPLWCCDTRQYWELGQSFLKSGHFRFLDFDQTYRGYLLSMMLAFLQSIGAAVGVNPFRVFFAFNAAVTSAALAVVVPLLVRSFTGQLPRTWQIFGFALLFFTFWRGFLLFPMSDTWSVFLAILAIWLMIESLGRSGASALSFALLAGV